MGEEGEEETPLKTESEGEKVVQPLIGMIAMLINLRMTFPSKLEDAHVGAKNGSR